MSKLRLKNSLILSVVLIAAVLLVVAACAKKEPAAPAPATAKPAPEATMMTADPLYEVLGKADAEKSGAADIQIGQDAVTVSYHYFMLKQLNFDKAFGPHIAPKIRDLYAKVKMIDQVVFDVSVADLGAELWKPRLHFLVDRKMIEETDWTKLLDADFFKVVKDLKMFD
ncbi:MAG: hypothetical protein NTZ26_02790 [Candidatus Aminicenantes bacterium]|nr:hypothetical protein [Candidatus Aminicenantes bacterium]